MDIGRMLFAKPKDTGFRIGFIAILLISIAFIFPTFYGLSSDSANVQLFQYMLLSGLVMTVFLSGMQMDKAKSKGMFNKLTPQAMSKQVAVFTLGVTSGVVLVLVNALANKSGNILLGSSVIPGVPMEAIYLGLLAGVAEELFFRGFVQNLVRMFVPAVVFAVVPSAIIFTIYHTVAYQSEVSLLVIFVLGLFLGVLHEMTNDIGVPMLAHVLNNIFSMFSVVVALVTGSLVFILMAAGIAVLVYMIGVSRRRRK